MKRLSAEEESVKKILEATNAANLPMFSEVCETSQVDIRPDKDVTLGKFRPDPQNPSGYIAHPTTIRAMKKDIFMAGEGFEDLEMHYRCYSCHTTLDLQFWNFCPFCEASIND
jgi:hypothetical protein